MLAIGDAVAPTTLAILMLLPLSALEATAVLPAAATQLTRSRIGARRLAELTAQTRSSRLRPPVPPVELAPGARLAVIGASGSGKTPLLMTLAETPLSAALFAEDAHVFATTVRDNLLVAGTPMMPSCETSCTASALLGGWAGCPMGCPPFLVGGAGASPPGQRRRLLLARALISPAPTVLLDEPTEHLDAVDSRHILTGLLTPGGLFAADRTVVVATHHLPKDVRCPTLNPDATGVTSSP